MSNAKGRKMPTFPLRLPASIKAEAERLAAADGTSLNGFVAAAVAEKVGALRATDYFATRRERADWAGFDRLMGRAGGAAPREGDEVLDSEKDASQAPGFAGR